MIKAKVLGSRQSLSNLISMHNLNEGRRRSSGKSETKKQTLTKSKSYGPIKNAEPVGQEHINSKIKRVFSKNAYLRSTDQ